MILTITTTTNTIKVERASCQCA